MGNKNCIVDKGLLHKDQWTKILKGYITHCVKKANAVTKITITWTSHRNVETGDFDGF